MDTPKLRVYAAGDTMIPNLEAEEAGARRYIGRRYDGDEPGGAGRWVPLDEPVEVPYRAEYVAAIKAGELHVADAESAKLAGLEAGDADADDTRTAAEREQDRAFQTYEQQQQPQAPQPSQQRAGGTYSQPPQIVQQPPAPSSYPAPHRQPIGGK